MTFNRKHIMLPDGGNLALDFTPPEAFGNGDILTPVVIVVHGALGGSNAPYVQAALEPLIRPKSRGGSGFRAVVMNFRGCNGSRLTSPHFYHPRITDDLASVILYLRSTLPSTPFFGLGFSMGAGVLTHYLNEAGDKSGLSAGFAVSNVFDYVSCTTELDSGSFVSRHLLNTAIGLGHRQIVAKNKAAFQRQHSSHISGSTFTPEDIRLQDAVHTLITKPIVTVSFFTSFFLPLVSDFKSDIDFLQQTSSMSAVSGVRVPLVFLNSEDDPLAGCNLPYEEVQRNPWTVLAVTSRGGHLGWYTSSTSHGSKQKMSSSWGVEQWSVKPVVEFFNAMTKLDLLSRPQPRTISVNQLGFVVQADRPTAGFKEVTAEYIAAIDLSRPMHERVDITDVRTPHRPYESFIQIFLVLSIFLQTIGLATQSTASKIGLSVPVAERSSRT